MEFTEHAEPLIVTDQTLDVDRLLKAGQPRQEGAAKRETARERRERRRREWEAANNAQALEVQDVNAVADIIPQVQRAESPKRDNVIDISNLSQGDRIRIFWELIPKFGWRNLSDGPCNHVQVERTFRGMTEQLKAVFADRYASIYADLYNKLLAEGVYERCNLNALADKVKVVSHFIAMGQDVYLSLFESPELVDFFVEQGDCQNFDETLPNELQH